MCSVVCVVVPDVKSSPSDASGDKAVQVTPGCVEVFVKWYLLCKAVQAMLVVV